MTGPSGRRERLAKQETVEVPVPISADELDVADPDAAPPAGGELAHDKAGAPGSAALAPPSHEGSVEVRRALAKMPTQELAVPVLGKDALGDAPAGKRYEVQRPIAEGAFGIVVEAKDLRSGRLVALKTLKTGTAPLDVARFEREAETARRLDHPGLVKVLESGVAEGAPFIAFELVPGKTLDARVREEGPLPERLALEVTLALARAVSHAHERGVLHRDVSPRNVLLTPLPTGGVRPVLADFGLAKDLLAADVLTRTGDILGNPVTLAPEVLKGGAARADERTDVFGLGAVLHFALTGQSPFPAKTLDELATRIEQGVPPPPGVSLATAALLAGALAAKREDRPPTAARFAQICQTALGSLEGGEPADGAPAGAEDAVGAAEESPSARTRAGSNPQAPTTATSTSTSVGASPAAATDDPAPPRKRRRWPLVIAALWLLVLVGAVAVGLEGRRRERALALDMVALALGKPAATPAQLRTAAEGALELIPDLDEAHALRALALARSGDLAEAERALAVAGTGPLAGRARGWVLFRQGKIDEALAALPAAGASADLPGLVFAAGRPETAHLWQAAVGHGTESWWRENLSGPAAKFVTVKANLDALVEAEPGTIEAHRALLLRALRETLSLEDEAADKDLARALDAPPRERTLAEELRARIQKLRGDGELDLPAPTSPPWPYPERTVIADRAEDAIATARLELEAHRLLDRPADLARATARLRRIVGLRAGGVEALGLLSHALARRPNENEPTLRKIAARLESLRPDDSFEAGRAYFALGDLDAARRVLARLRADTVALRVGVPDRLAAVVEKNDALAAKLLGFTTTKPDEIARCGPVLRALLLDRPWEGTAELEELRELAHLAPRSSAVVASILAKSNPIGALAALARDPANQRPSGDVVRIAAVLSEVLPVEPEKLKEQLTVRDADAALGLRLLERGREERGKP